MPAESFQVEGGSKKNSLTGESAGAQAVKVAALGQSMRRKSLRTERTRAIAELRREREIKEREREEQQEEKEEEEEKMKQTMTRTKRMARIKTVTEVGGDDDAVPTTSIRPLTKFILPLHYSHNQGDVCRKLWQEHRQI